MGPMLFYGSVTWTIKKKLMIFENKVPRNIYGLTYKWKLDRHASCQGGGWALPV